MCRPQTDGIWVQRDLIIAAGWQPREDGVRRLTTYAAKRVARGAQPKNRQGYARAEDHKRGERPSHRGEFAKHMTRMKCPECGQINDLDHDELRIGTFDATGKKTGSSSY